VNESENFFKISPEKSDKNVILNFLFIKYSWNNIL